MGANIGISAASDELHDYIDEGKRKLGKLVEKLVNLPYPLLESGSEHVRVGQPLGASAESYAEFVAAREATFEMIADTTLPHFEL
ncbi:oxidoreductase, short-chain dehydrogenase/reductase family [Metarhizium brunneum]